MKNLTLIVLILLMALITTTELFAATQGFTVGAAVTDTVAPSQPAGLSALAVSSSRIDLSWTTSTDDVGVTGYHIYRGAAIIATTTVTNYADTGLAASTHYDYAVAAIDAAGNESALSSTADATTTAATAPQGSPEGSGSSGQSVQVPIYGVIVTPNATGLKVEWKTSFVTHGMLQWGKSADYELGSISEILSGTAHSAEITGLESDTDYVLRIEVLDTYGRVSSLGGIAAHTLAAPRSDALANVTNFRAVQSGSAIDLTWTNPTQRNFAEVRIVKSEMFFPVDPEDGEAIYEGREQRFSDTEVRDGAIYYYAAFARDSAGNWTSGAVASAAFASNGTPVPIGNPLENLPQSPIIDPRIQSLTLADFVFSQDGMRVTFAEAQKLLVDGAKNLKISLAYNRVPEILKTIAVTFTDPEDETKVFTFLLKVNEEKTSYEAIIAPLEKAGEYGVRIAVVDYKNRGMKRIEGTLLATAAAFDEQAEGSPSQEFSALLAVEFIKLLSLIALLAKLLLVAERAWRRPVLARVFVRKT